jgi:hypothetical protein
MSTVIDLNCDIGEGFGRWRMPYDAELMELVTTVSIAAGFHAGDPTIIRATVDKAVAEGLDLGVHVALPDLLGFGRRAMAISPAELRDYGTYQIGAVAAFVRVAGGVLTHVKPHGALYVMASRDPELADAIALAISEHDPGCGCSCSTATAPTRRRSTASPWSPRASPSCTTTTRASWSSNGTSTPGTRPRSPAEPSPWPKETAWTPGPGRTWTWTSRPCVSTATAPTPWR